MWLLLVILLLPKVHMATPRGRAFAALDPHIMSSSWLVTLGIGGLLVSSSLDGPIRYPIWKSAFLHHLYGLKMFKKMVVNS